MKSTAKQLEVGIKFRTKYSPMANCNVKDLAIVMLIMKSTAKH